MPTSHAEKYISRAEKGDKLTVKERRHVITYLMGTGRTAHNDATGKSLVDASEQYATNVAMAELFQVSERQVRMDKAWVKEERARFIKHDDISLVLADIALSFDRQVNDIEDSKRKCDKGTRTYLEHCKAIFNLEIAKVNALQSLGYYPKDLGQLTVQKFEYKATVGVMASLESTPEATATRQKALDDSIIDAEMDDQLLLGPGEVAYDEMGKPQ